MKSFKTRELTKILRLLDNSIYEHKLRRLNVANAIIRGMRNKRINEEKMKSTRESKLK